MDRQEPRAMFLWIESHSSFVIVLAVSALCYALAAIIAAGAMLLSRSDLVLRASTLSPVTLTPLAMIAGLLLIFLASHVWSTADRARAIVGQEANAIQEAILLADTLPQPTRRAVHDGVAHYLRWVDAQDWPAMTEGRAHLWQPPPGLPDAIRALESFAPGTSVAQQAAVTALEQALDAWRSRILISHATIAPSQWIVIFVLDALILLTIAIIHIRQPASMIAGLFIFSTAVASCLMLLMVNDRPFSVGGVTVQPTVLRDIVGH